MASAWGEAPLPGAEGMCLFSKAGPWPQVVEAEKTFDFYLHLARPPTALPFLAPFIFRLPLHPPALASLGLNVELGIQHNFASLWFPLAGKVAVSLWKSSELGLRTALAGVPQALR